MATDPFKYMIPIGTNGNQATIGDRLVVSADEGRSPNARVNFAPCWRGAASTTKQLKWFREFLRQNAEIQFRFFLEVTCSPLVNMQIFGTLKYLIVLNNKSSKFKRSVGSC